MKTLFPELSWKVAFRQFRRRGPAAPIRRRPPGKLPNLELVRLDDRALPGSVLATAAAQALLLSGPVAWLGLAASDLTAVGPAAEGTDPRPVAAGTPGSDADGLDESARDQAFFSFTSPAAIADERDGSPPTITAAGASLQSQAPWGDLGDPGADASAAVVQRFSAAAPDPATGTGGGGGGTGAFAPPVVGSGESGGAPPASRTATPPAAEPVAPAGSTAAPPPRRAPTARPQPNPGPAPVPAHTPSGHFAQRLQLLLHPDGTSGSLNLGGARDRQTQFGATIGDQLFGGLSLFGSGHAAAHRGASLLGQALGAGSDDSIGLRQSPSSSGLFGLVGSHSVGDLLDGPGHRGSLAAAGDALAAAAPAAAALPRQTGAVMSGGIGRSVADGSGPGDTSAGAAAGPPPGRLMPGVLSDAANFTLVITLGDAGDGPTTLTETGTVTFPPNWDVNSPTYPLSVSYSYTLSGPGGTTDSGDVAWSGDATPQGVLFGYDIDAANLQTFGIDRATVPYYVLDAGGTDSFVGTDTTTPAEQNGTVTTQHGFDNALAGTDGLTLHVEGPGGAQVVTWDDTVNSTFTDQDTGTDTATPTDDAPQSLNDNFTATDTGTHVETDHVEGTIGPDGAYQLTSFSFDSTDDYDYSDSVSGTEGQPEPGGSESDSFSETDHGHGHEHLHAAGTPDSWTASLDDDTGSDYSERDDGSESSSESAGSTTDTNGDTFHADDAGRHTDDLHVAGTGTATTFTATSVSDRIEDAYDFHDHDDGTAGETGTTGGESDSDSDQYHEADDGHADEVLTVTGGADALTGTYSDTVHDGFSDSDAEHDAWDDPADHDAGSDDSTAGDSGSEDIRLAASATLDGWQSDGAGDWQITSASGDVTGSADVHAGDDGTDGAADGGDSETEHFVDSSTGTDGFEVHLSGDGTTFTLSESTTLGLSIQTEDDTTGHWRAPNTLDGEPATDTGSEEIDDTEGTTAAVMVMTQQSIDAAGNATPIASHVDVTAGGTTHVTDDGSDDDAASGVDDRETVDDDTQLSRGVHVHADVSADGTAAVAVDQQFDGGMTLGGSEDDSDSVNPDDRDTEDGGAHLSGTVGGDVHQTGTVTADGQVQAAAASGELGLDADGSVTETDEEVLHADYGPEPGDPTGIPTPSGDFSVAAELYHGEDYDIPSPYPPAGPADVTVTTTVSVPQVHVGEGVEDTGSEWDLDHLDETVQASVTTQYTGHYTNTLLFAGGTGSGGGSTTDTVTISVSGTAAGLTGSVTTTDIETNWADAGLEGGDDDTGNPSYTGSASITGVTGRSETDTGTFVPGGAVTLTRQNHQEWGSDTFTFHIEAPDEGLTMDYTKKESHGLSDDGTAAVGTVMGTDSYDVTFHTKQVTDSAIYELQDDYLGTGTYQRGPNNDVVLNTARSEHGYTTFTDLATGDSSTTPIYDQGQNAVEENVWWRALNPFTSAPDIDPGSIGAAGSLESWIPVWGPFRNGINDLQNGRIASAVKNGVLVATDISLVRSAIGLVGGGFKWAGGKLFGEAAEKVGAEAGTGAASHTGRLVCFPAGTPVHTTAGLKPIERIEAGERVWAYDHVRLQWAEREVVEVFQHLNEGPVATIRVDGETLRATGGHPFWVVRGEGLADRPLPVRIGAYEPGGRQPGRWVLAQDLRPGDVVLLRRGEMTVLASVQVADAVVRVYNFRVADLQNYAIGRSGVLVHNTNDAHHGIDIERLRPTETVAAHAAERPYINSPLTIRNIIESGRPIPDPGGVAGALRWDVLGSFRGSEGTFELVIDPSTNRILHFLFRSAR